MKLVSAVIKPCGSSDKIVRLGCELRGFITKRSNLQTVMATTSWFPTPPCFLRIWHSMQQRPLWNTWLENMDDQHMFIYERAQWAQRPIVPFVHISNRISVRVAQRIRYTYTHMTISRTPCQTENAQDIFLHICFEYVHVVSIYSNAHLRSHAARMDLCDGRNNVPCWNLGWRQQRFVLRL